jgi:hypothetical protein
VSSDELPEKAKRRAVADIASRLEAAVLRPRVVRRLRSNASPRRTMAFAGVQADGRIVLGIDTPA